MWFGDEFLPKENKNLTVIKDDIRNTDNLRNACINHDVFLKIKRKAELEAFSKYGLTNITDKYLPQKLELAKSL